MGKPERLDKILSNSGVGTRKEVKQLVKKGFIKVGDQLVLDPSKKLDPENEVIFVKDKILKYKPYIYIMMNKPKGVISATWDSKHKTVIDLLDEQDRVFDPFPVGRLDINTTGLLLLTNDGGLAHDLLSPKKNVGKLYSAILKYPVGDREIEEFKNGIELDDGYICKPSELYIGNPANNVEIVIYEGKYHQVKRMFEAVGNKVHELKRLKMGPLKLDKDLKLGEYRELCEEEVNDLKIFPGK